MCLCTPNIRTPWCGKPGCEVPKQNTPVMSHEVSKEDKLISDLKYILATRHTIPAGTDENAPYVLSLLSYIKSYTEAYASNLSDSERFDYNRLKQLEVRGLEEYKEMQGTAPLTAERVVAFINQLSPWNLKTTGVSVLEAYATEKVKETEKAFGGCKNCYGKGYSTYRSALISNDTDQDIGSPGGRTYKPFEEMRFCECGRGQQLAQLTKNKIPVERESPETRSTGETPGKEEA